MGSTATGEGKAAITRSMPLRVAIYFGGILILGVGVVLSARSDFGAPAFQSIPLVFSEGTHLLTLGQSCICLYCIDILIQVLVFRTLNVKIALQIPFAFAFGCLIDLFDFVLGLDFFWILCVKLGYGATGVWIAMVLDWICRTAFFVWRFCSGVWKKKRLVEA